MSELEITEAKPQSIDVAAKQVTEIIEQIEKAVIADREFLEILLTTVLSRGHIHLEDVPGTGKTVTAQVLAQALGISFNRIQFTPDLLPADITGSHVYNEQDQTFSFQEGPVFANVVLADEINRAPPKTQAALLEAMGEEQVTIDGDSYELPAPFFVIATQNPIDQQGTFELPEAQRDRFSIKASMGYPEASGELELLKRREDRISKIPEVNSVTTPAELQRIQATAEQVMVSDDVKQYMIRIARATRSHNAVKTGVSPRGIQKMFETARGLAVVDGQDYVQPHHVKRLAPYLYSHRLVLTEDARINNMAAESVIDAVIGSVSVPKADGK